VSLEGLPAYNDFIRGKGHFERTMGFLEILRELEVYSMVMLTLTRENIHQVLPLADLLRGKADVFYFNRLSKVGQGESLELPPKQDYRSFLERYVEASEQNPVLGLKDNLINVLKYQKGSEPFGGCTGFGCGAAFNFVAVLADGEVHACRKFPSLIGNIFHQRIEEIYDSKIAQRYRAGCAECRSCLLRPVCGGCLASAYSYGFDVFEKKDPYCFL
jgi:selenobiotic family peptide radical SAM maturase